MENMNVESLRNFRDSIEEKLNRGEDLTEYELNQIAQYTYLVNRNKSSIIDPENIDDSSNKSSEETLEKQKTLGALNGHNMYPDYMSEHENSQVNSQAAFSNIVFLAAISLVMEMLCLFGSFLIFK